MSFQDKTNIMTKQIQTGHKDLIQDIAFDFYGKRAATASLDHTVKIWNIGENNEWVPKEELKVIDWVMTMICIRPVW